MKHVFVQRKCGGVVVSVDESSNESVPNEGGTMGKREEEFVSIREVSVGGKRKEGNEFTGGERVEKSGGDEELRMHLLDLRDCTALIQQRKGSSGGFDIFRIRGKA